LVILTLWFVKNLEKLLPRAENSQVLNLKNYMLLYIIQSQANLVWLEHLLWSCDLWQKWTHPDDENTAQETIRFLSSIEQDARTEIWLVTFSFQVTWWIWKVNFFVILLLLANLTSLLSFLIHKNIWLCLLFLFHVYFDCLYM